jgi:hypothetical protein
MDMVDTEEGLLRVFLTAQTIETRYSNTGNGEKTISALVSLRNGLAAGFSSGCPKPEAPGELAVEGGLGEIYPCRILISWDPVTVDTSGEELEEAGCPVTGYRVYFDSVPGVFGNYVDVSTNEASGCVVDVSEIPSSEFYLSVAAENSGGLGEKSPEVEITDTTPPGKAMGVSAVAGVDEVDLLWEENSECDLVGYYIYRKKDTGSFVLAAGLISAGSTEYMDTGLEAGAEYTYTVEAVDFGFNAGEASDAVMAVLP